MSSDLNNWRGALTEISTAQKSGKIDEALRFTENALINYPSSLPLRAKHLQLLLIDRQIDQACQEALKWRSWPSLDERTANLVFKSLSRGEAYDELIALHLNMPAIAAKNPQIACMIADTYTAMGNDIEAMAVLQSHQKQVGALDTVICERMSELYAKLGDIDSSNSSALLALEKDPDNVRAGMRLSRNLLGAGSPATALNYLEHIIDVAPHLTGARTSAARAAKLSGDPERAVNILSAIPESELLRNRANERLLISTLMQAGQIEKAEMRYQAMIDRLRMRQPITLTAALEAEVPVHSDFDARMRWAGDLTESSTRVSNPDWIKSALWGYHADITILDWLETRPDAMDELMSLFVDLTPAEALMKKFVGDGEASLIVSAHIGALYAGPVALELLGVDAKWLASSPNPPGAHYGKKLISTADNNESHVALSVRTALKMNKTVVLALDGTSNPAAPRVDFEGHSVTYSNFAAMLSARMKVPAIFASPIWTVDRKIDFYVAPMPAFENGMRMAEHIKKWQESYFHHVKAVLKTRPENLRLSGGIWRYVR